MDDDLEEYLSNIGKVPPLDEREEAELWIKIRAGDRDAAKRFAEPHLALAARIARKYYPKDSSLGISFRELIQAANVGLMRAVTHFEPSRGFDFAAYATWWIRQSVTQTIAEKRRSNG